MESNFVGQEEVQPGPGSRERRVGKATLFFPGRLSGAGQEELWRSRQAHVVLPRHLVCSCRRVWHLHVHAEEEQKID